MITLFTAERAGNRSAFNPRFLLREGFSKWINEIVVLVDSESPDVIGDFQDIKFLYRKMNNNFVEHYNYGLEHCTNEWIYIMADDEFPPPAVILGGLDLIKKAANHKAIAFPRANWWTWQEKENPVLWPDYQHRMIRRGVKLLGDVHERLDVAPEEVLPMPELAIYTINHLKTQEMQEASGRLYDELAAQGRT